ncbi:MAG: nodulation protein NfeD [Bacteroidetes bacterium]|nr:nodulation protein NfeD [Bacteroidota bacterium]MDA1119094.1 nodulation protein NfeD [Bacteroidota bacterium]
MRLLLLYFIFLIGHTVLAMDEDSTSTAKKVFVMEIKAEIDPRMNHYVELALDEAKEINADLVIIEMDTYGGAVNDADDIRTMILEFEKPILVFINKDAASAGALISIACDSIYMAPGSSIGAATVVTAEGEAAPDKYQSYMRSMMRSTAEANGRNPRIAEAMVDQSIEIDSISSEGKVLTFSTSEAIKYGFCEAQVRNIDEILLRNDIKDYDIVSYNLSSSDKVVSFFLNPFISGILILIILGGIYFELQTPGIGFPLLASIVATIFYFIPYYLGGLAEHWEIAMFFAGIALIALEIFVIPGFGVAGVTGIVFTLSSLILVMLNNDAFDFSFVKADAIFVAILTTVSGLAGSFILLFIGGVRLAESKFFKRVALQTVQDKSEGYSAASFRTESLLGRKGVAYTNLRPSGKIMINEDIYDAFTRGNYILKDVAIEVISEEGTSLKVREIPEG